MNALFFDLALFLNAFEDPFVFALLIASLALLIGRARRIHGLAFFASLALTFAAIHILKSAFGVARPEDAFVDAGSTRFPSMHAGIVSAIAVSLYVLLLPALQSRTLRITALFSAFALVVLVSATRITLNVHEPIDVIVGAAVGAAITAGTYRLLLLAQGAENAKTRLG